MTPEAQALREELAHLRALVGTDGSVADALTHLGRVLLDAGIGLPACDRAPTCASLHLSSRIHRLADERDTLLAQLAALTPKPPPEPAADPWADFPPRARELYLNRGRASRRRGEPRVILPATPMEHDPSVFAFIAGWDIEDARLARAEDEDDGALDAAGETGGEA